MSVKVGHGRVLSAGQPRSFRLSQISSSGVLRYGPILKSEGGLVTEADERWRRDLSKQVVSAAQLPAFVPYDLRHTFASLLLSSNVPLLYVSKPTITLDHYAKWLPSGEQRFVNELDSQVEKVGTKTWHQVDISEENDSEVVEKVGGPCRGRTYGPLIKSKANGVAQVLDGLGNPFSFLKNVAA